LHKRSDCSTGDIFEDVFFILFVLLCFFLLLFILFILFLFIFFLFFYLFYFCLFCLFFFVRFFRDESSTRHATCNFIASIIDALLIPEVFLGLQADPSGPSACNDLGL